MRNEPDDMENDAIEPVDETPAAPAPKTGKAYFDAVRARLMALPYEACPWCSREFHKLETTTVKWQGETREVKTCDGCRVTPRGILGLANELPIQGARVEGRPFSRARGDANAPDTDFYGVVARDGIEFFISATFARVRVKDSRNPTAPKDFLTIFGAWAHVAAQLDAPDAEVERPRKQANGPTLGVVSPQDKAANDRPNLWGDL